MFFKIRNRYRSTNRTIMKSIKKRMKNILLPKKTWECIKFWENKPNGVTIRSSFNRELYYQILELRK